MTFSRVGRPGSVVDARRAATRGRLQRRTTQEGPMGMIALLAGVVGLIWVWVRGTRRDYEAMVARQQQYAKQAHDGPMDRSNPDFIPGHTGRSGGFWF